MDINVLLKLTELKKQEINSLKNDYVILDRIVLDFDRELENQFNFINDFIRDFAGKENYNNNPIGILNGREFLKKLNLKSKNLETSRVEAERQKLAAFESLKESAIGLRKLKKIIDKERKLELEDKARKELIIEDTLEIYRYNKINS